MSFLLTEFCRVLGVEKPTKQYKPGTQRSAAPPNAQRTTERLIIEVNDDYPEIYHEHRNL